MRLDYILNVRLVEISTRRRLLDKLVPLSNIFKQIISIIRSFITGYVKINSEEEQIASNILKESNQITNRRSTVSFRRLAEKYFVEL